MTIPSPLAAPLAVPFVDLTWQHGPLQEAIQGVINAVIIQGDFVLGQALADFEANFALACGTQFGVGVGCGTDAIALGLIACGVAPGDEVILPANTFVATLMGVLRSGATPVFVDCDRATALIDLDAAARAITPRTRAIVPVHLYGQMVSPQGLLDLAHRHRLIIFEDAAQAHLAQREGYTAGSIGLGAAFSFYPSKNLGALGDGGMFVTGDQLIAGMARSLRNYGATSKYYHTEPLGTNSRLDTLQAAVLNVKLPHLAGWNRARYAIAQHYDRRLAPLVEHGILPIGNGAGPGHVYHLYVVRITDTCPISRANLQTQFTTAGIQTGIHYPIPCHLQPAFSALGYGLGSFPQAEALSQEILSLPMYPGMTLEQVDYVVDAMVEAVTAARSVGVLQAVNG
ncbi:DegT/DnrJ/EryC1/StrS family aminotransferase [Phormidium tenue]|uniref:Erythromycin biosynthesis sensory transduction protein eryC1 n=1 Tax=Phormidium tenue NIES-30 TaxID=549789 RepID=A0A1U7J3Q3_9CYAN|nr:DegT/DnrJ/EryC1/StrS family aminotransferase [Phormidium tenue]MBD2233109.1 DegT/DnrJ/EryC1/StrS family aminotransferase [Phormidium tenue FACHB-1052]OKH47087.1 erythromycin biosynthesis sensory transduction protein eryC1 [Phormidium tenue NIES-30]